MQHKKQSKKDSEELFSLREYLFKKKIKLDDFAKKVGVNRSTLHRIMKGESDPSLSIAIKIVKATQNKVSYEKLCDIEDLEVESESFHTC